MATLPKSPPTVTDAEIALQIGGQVCPHCGCRVIKPDTGAADLGICEVCYRRARNDALADTVALTEARREGNRLKKQLQRARASSKNGIRDNPASLSPWWKE
jgi:hypothetical protein